MSRLRRPRPRSAGGILAPTVRIMLPLNVARTARARLSLSDPRRVPESTYSVQDSRKQFLQRIRQERCDRSDRVLPYYVCEYDSRNYQVRNPWSQCGRQSQQTGLGAMSRVSMPRVSGRPGDLANLFQGRRSIQRCFDCRPGLTSAATRNKLAAVQIKPQR